MNNAIPCSITKYDGIKELDNKLPRWWVWLFNLTTIFAVIYMAYYHAENGSMPGTEVSERIAAARPPWPPAVVATMRRAAGSPAVEEPSKDEAVLAKGKQLFTVNCAVCHGQNGEGLIGPNFCDDSFIHGPAFADSLHIIREGVLAKGMISWKAVLKPDDILAVGSYIYSLRGSNPPNPKAPEGVKAGS
jgi:cytochrome c oxidase cbb3-type subunit 3